MIGRGYGTPKEVPNWVDNVTVEDGKEIVTPSWQGDKPSDLTDPELIQAALENRENQWGNLFMFDGKTQWGLIDLDFVATLANYEEIYECMRTGEGRFGRLKTIWDTINTPPYTVKPKR